MAFVRSTQTAVLIARDSSAGKQVRSTQVAILIARDSEAAAFTPFEPGDGSYTFTGYAPTLVTGFTPPTGVFWFTGYAPRLKVSAFLYNVSPGLGLEHVWSSQADKAAQADSIFGLLDYAMAGQTVVDVAVDDNLSLSADDIKNVFIEITDTGVALTIARLVYVPSGSRIWWIKNSTAESLTITPISNSVDLGAGAVITAGKNALVRVNDFTAYAKELD